MRRRLATAILPAVFCFVAAAAIAQQPAAPKVLPPGSPEIGRPDDNAAAAKLSPIPAPPIAAAANKLPLDKFNLPPSFKVEVYASGIANARSLTRGDKGTVFAGSRVIDKVYAFKGVPYGASTAGAGRFMPPVKPQPWTDIKDATQIGHRSPQS